MMYNTEMWLDELSQQTEFILNDQIKFGWLNSTDRIFDQENVSVLQLDTSIWYYNVITFTILSVCSNDIHVLYQL